MATGRWPSMRLLSALIVTLFLSIPIMAQKEKTPKTGILLIAFGTSIPEAQQAYNHIAEKVQAAFPGMEVRWGITSAMVRRKLAKAGQQLDSPASALARMADDGFTHVAVQSLHVIPGAEYHDLLRTVHALQGLPKGLVRVTVGDPLLCTHPDMLKTTDALVAWAAFFRKSDEAVLFMGHGTHHPSNIYYPGLQYYLQQRDTLLFIGTVEGYPELEDVKQKLIDRQVKTAWLVPLMTVAGDHALNDMTGEDDQSWENILNQSGITTRPLLKGLGQVDALVDIWVEHLRAAVNQLGVQH